MRRALAEAVEKSGELPPERQLAEALGVPRSRLRRVLAELRDAGVLPPAQVGRRTSREGNPQVDTLAKVANPTDVIELRLMLEPHFARLAAIRGSALQIARIVRAATSRTEDDYGGTDLAFHAEIAEASRNALAREFYNTLRQVGADARVRLPSRKPMCVTRRKARDAEHLKIAHAIADRDPEGAEEAMRSHLASVRALIMDRLSPEPQEAPAAANESMPLCRESF